MRFRSQSWQWECVCYKEHIVHTKQSVSLQSHQRWHNNFTKRSNTYIHASDTQISTETHNPRVIWQEMWNILRKKQNPYIFLKIGEEVKENMEILCVNTVIMKEGKVDKRMNSHEMRGKNEKFLKLFLKKTLIVQNTWFLRLNQVADKLPGQVTK